MSDQEVIDEEIIPIETWSRAAEDIKKYHRILSERPYIRHF